jgi:hypothetical protein
LAGYPLAGSAEIEVARPRRGYRVMRKAECLRRKERIDCRACGESLPPSAHVSQTQKNRDHSTFALWWSS